MAETDLAASIQAVFGRGHAEARIVINGVTCYADLVYQVSTDIHVYEFKAKLTQGLVLQVERLLPFCDRIWAVTWKPFNISLAHEMRRRQLEQLGAGLVYVRQNLELARQFEPELRVRRSEALKDALTERQKHGLPAGSAAGIRVRKDEWDDARQLLERFPGMTGKQIARDLGWPYDKRHRFVTMARKGRVDKVRCEDTAPSTFFLIP